MPRRDWFKSGEWNALCDQCGVKRKSGELQERWDHLMVCRPSIKPGCWEPRHPQELLRPIDDSDPLPWTRPEPADVYISSVVDTVAVTAGSSSVTITDASITSASTILIQGTVPIDSKLVIGKVTPGSGSATVTFAIAPAGDLTLYYVIVG